MKYSVTTSSPTTSNASEMSIEQAIAGWREKQKYCEQLESVFPKAIRIENLRNNLIKHPANKIDPSVKRKLEHGWLIPHLLTWDLITWQRWHYLEEIAVHGKLLERDIPQIEFCFGDNGKNNVKTVGSPARRHLEACLDLIPNSSGWRGWGNWSYFSYFLQWLLFGFGDPTQLEEPKEPVAGASMRLYQYFDLAYLILFPWDYFGDLLAENRYGKESAFYPTPHCVIDAMAQMVFHDVGKEDCRDARLTNFCESCCGSGRVLLYASNYTLMLSGADINETLVKTTLTNGYLYAPWLVKPILFLEKALDSSNLAA